MTKYIPTIGMEVHVELKTDSKMFCSCKNGMGMEKEPNVNICPVCTGQPGSLPVPNQRAIEFVQMAGLALNCEIKKKSKFDRKNYFYPDLPKGYQISQYDQPFCEKGSLRINGKVVGITRIHLEEDTGKLIHPKGVNHTLVDFNRAGVPLMELVTEPDIESAKEASAFCQKLQQICRYLKISDADMEKGMMRCEVNLSLHKEGEDKLSGIKVEVKNINSFKFVEKAIEYEIKRQEEALEKGEKIVQETRGFDSNRNVTVTQRTKESAHDYRYFPEPDIPPFNFDEKWIESLRNRLPELPEQKSMRFKEEYNLPQSDIDIIISQKDLADYFEEVVSEIKDKISCQECTADQEKAIKISANYIITELRKNLAETGQSVGEIKITAENFAELVGIIAEGRINSSTAQKVLSEMFKTGADPSQIVEEKNLAQMNDSDEIELVVEQIISANAKSVEDYRNGKDKALQFLVGQVMKETKGKANPAVAMDILKSKIKPE